MSRLSALIRAAALSLALASAGGALAATTQAPLKEVSGGLSFQGPLGKFDQGSLQRGYKVYAEVCSSCHSMNLMYYRNLCQPGGPFYHKEYPNPNDSPYCKAIAADIKVPDIDPATGDPITRPATSADSFRNPYPNIVAAAAGNGGAAPPDLSLMARAREGGPQYIYSILTGYANPPGGLAVSPGKYYNPYYPGDLSGFWSGSKTTVPMGGVFSMPFQLTPDRVSFDDGTKATTEQEAKDVATFLAWTAEPKQQERKEAGLAVMIYLILFSAIVYPVLSPNLAGCGALGLGQRAGDLLDRGGRLRPVAAGDDRRAGTWSGGGPRRSCLDAVVAAPVPAPAQSVLQDRLWRPAATVWRALAADWRDRPAVGGDDPRRLLDQIDRRSDDHELRRGGSAPTRHRGLEYRIPRG